MTMNELLNWIEAERKRQGLTQSALAARSHIDVRSLRRNLSRSQPHSRGSLASIVKGLGYQLQTGYAIQEAR
jgi:transcriptional regulator with XRE-family HTH domain